MKIAIITGSNGLIGSEAVKFFCNKGFTVLGIDNDMRKYFFGKDASTFNMGMKLSKDHENFYSNNIDIRDYDSLEDVFRPFADKIEIVIHTAAQPSHDWAAKEPFTDFSVNATGTLNMLEVTRKYCPNAVFIYTSTNKVYGDTPNSLPLTEFDDRYELLDHRYKSGIDETMSIDNSKHSIFGVSKLAADVMVQEYGKYFGMKTTVFRGGCLTGGGHAGTMLHGYLSYIVHCAVNKKPYTVFGYKGKQVRDNIHSEDLISAFWEVYLNPRKGEVYNIGGSRHSNISVLETIKLLEELGYPLDYKIVDDNRIGDHIWYISDVSKFQEHYPDWKYKWNIKDIIKDIIKSENDKRDNSN